jgi:hypothetical protein
MTSRATDTGTTWPTRARCELILVEAKRDFGMRRHDHVGGTILRAGRSGPGAAKRDDVHKPHEIPLARRVGPQEGGRGRS